MIGAGTKILGELAFPPRVPGEPIPPAVAVSKALTYLSGSPLREEHVTLAVQGFHWSFSITLGAVYGAVAEFCPLARIGYGAGFGLLVQLLTHETLLPLTGLSLPWSEIPLKEHLSEIVTHIVYGVTTELIRRMVRDRFFVTNETTARRLLS